MCDILRHFSRCQGVGLELMTRNDHFNKNLFILNSPYFNLPSSLTEAKRLTSTGDQTKQLILLHVPLQLTHKLPWICPQSNRQFWWNDRNRPRPQICLKGSRINCKVQVKELKLRHLYAVSWNCNKNQPHFITSTTATATPSFYRFQIQIHYFYHYSRNQILQSLFSPPQQPSPSPQSLELELLSTEISWNIWRSFLIQSEKLFQLPGKVYKINRPVERATRTLFPSGENATDQTVPFKFLTFLTEIQCPNLNSGDPKWGHFRHNFQWGKVAFADATPDTWHPVRDLEGLPKHSKSVFYFTCWLFHRPNPNSFIPPTSCKENLFLFSHFCPWKYPKPLIWLRSRVPRV